jgi:hypothetical protein
MSRMLWEAGQHVHDVYRSGIDRQVRSCLHTTWCDDPADQWDEAGGRCNASPGQEMPVDA